MSTLSSKSDQEISRLLDEYGIKHGPVVDSTRALYEKKILEAMGRHKPKASPDKTFYREEQEEVTYVSYRTPIKSEVYRDGEPYSRSRLDHTHRDFQDEKPYLKAKSDYLSDDFVDKPYDTPSTYRTVSFSNATPVKPSTPAPGSSRLIPLWVQLLVFLVVAVFLYFVFCNMESTHSDPFKGLQ